MDYESNEERVKRVCVLIKSTGFTVEEFAAGLRQIQGRTTANQDAKHAVGDERARQFDRALTPSAETKMTHSGEYKFDGPEGDQGESEYEITVPWTTIKEIMAAIRADALSEKPGGQKALVDRFALARLLDAARDMLSGWRYIRSVHGELSGVGWARAEDGVVTALNEFQVDIAPGPGFTPRTEISIVGELGSVTVHGKVGEMVTLNPGTHNWRAGKFEITGVDSVGVYVQFSIGLGGVTGRSNHGDYTVIRETKLSVPNDPEPTTEFGREARHIIQTIDQYTADQLQGLFDDAREIPGLDGVSVVRVTRSVRDRGAPVFTFSNGMTRDFSGGRLTSPINPNPSAGELAAYVRDIPRDALAVLIKTGEPIAGLPMRITVLRLENGGKNNTIAILSNGDRVDLDY